MVPKFVVAVPLVVLGAWAPSLASDEILPRRPNLVGMEQIEFDRDVVTIGQYLQPSPKHAPIDRWVHPDEFRMFREEGERMGFGSVFSGPLVRSSYRADEQRQAAR